MPCSPAQLAANRANALKSTGPRTEAGKARSRANAIKHGLTGAGVALPTEDVAVVAARFEAFRDELAPRTVLGGFLARRAAMLSVRLDRCERREAASLATRIGHAAEDFDEARMADVQRLVEALDADPAGAVRNLRRTPEGVDRLASGWASIRRDLDLPGLLGWFTPQRHLAAMLEGRPSQALGCTAIDALFRATQGDCEYLEPGEWSAMEDLDRRRWAVDRLKEAVDARLAELAGHRSGLDLGRIERDRSRAADAALFDGTKEGVLARKYEAAAERAFFRTLKELRQVEAEAREEESGSFSPGDEGGEEDVAGEVPEPVGTRPGAGSRPISAAPDRPEGPFRASRPSARRRG